MKTKIYLIAFSILLSALVFSPLSFAKEDYCVGKLNCVDAAGMRQGYWEITAQMMGADEFNNPGKVIKKGNYENSEPTGIWEEIHIDGTVTEWYYDDTSDLAIAQRFYKDDGHNMLYETRYMGNLHEGPAKIYYPNGGKLAMELTWMEGRMRGPMKTYYPSGKLCEEGLWFENYWLYDGYTLYSEQGKVIRATPPAMVVGPEGVDHSVYNGK